MKNIIINNKNYEIIKDDGIFNAFEMEEKLTDYFDDYDYIFGDQSYGKIRLKGFYDSNNKNKKNINDIKILDSYITNYCSYGCKTFLIKKVK